MTKTSSLTLWQVWGHIGHLLCVDVRPVKVIIGILLVITLREAFIKCAASCKEKHKLIFGSHQHAKQLLDDCNKSIYFLLQHEFLSRLIL